MKSKNLKIRREKAATLHLAPAAGPQCSPPFEQELQQSLPRLPGKVSLTRLVPWTRCRDAADLGSSASWAVGRALKWLSRSYGLSTTKRLRVAETLSLGEKRFVAILKVDGCDFLIGGGTSGVSLLAHMEKPIEPSGDGLEIVKAPEQ